MAGRGNPSGPPPAGRTNHWPQRRPPDLDELWRDFNLKLGGLFGGGKGGPDRRRWRTTVGNFQPDGRAPASASGLLAGVVVLIWLGGGFFIVQEGQQAVVTTFGKFSPRPTPASSGAAVRRSRRTRRSASRRSAFVEGATRIVQATGLRDSSMLTQDENIVDIQLRGAVPAEGCAGPSCSRTATRRRSCRRRRPAVREIVGDARWTRALRAARRRSPPSWCKLDAEPSSTATTPGIRGDQRQHAGWRTRPRAGAGGVRRCLKAGPGSRAFEERRPGLRQRRDPEGAGHRTASLRERPGLQGPQSSRRPRATPSARSVLTGVPEGATGDARPHVPRHHAAGLLQRQQG